MKKTFLLFPLFWLTACASAPQPTDTFLLDSNVTSAVYCDDTFLGTTPLRVSTSKTCIMRLEKNGYKTAAFRFENLKTIWPSENGKFVFSKQHGIFEPTGRAIFNSYNFIVENDSAGVKLISSPGVIVSLPSLTVLLIADNALNLALLPVDVAVNGLDYSSVETYNKLYIDIVIPFNADGYFFEMMPDGKKAFSEKDVNELRTKLFVLKNFNGLKSANPEYAGTLTALTNKAFVLPPPESVPSEYFRTIF